MPSEEATLNSTALLKCDKHLFFVLLLEDGKRTDVDKEFHLFFSVTDENKSWYLAQNIQHYCWTPDDVDESDPEFVESNLMHGKASQYDLY